MQTSNKPIPVLPEVTSVQLFKGAQIVKISHAGQCYQLRITRENKLILTK